MGFTWHVLCIGNQEEANKILRDKEDGKNDAKSDYLAEGGPLDKMGNTRQVMARNSSEKVRQMGHKPWFFILLKKS